MLVTRLVFERVCSAIEPGEVICHDCDTPRCINWFHLFAGTDELNHRDRNRKGRQAQGVRNGRAKLTPDAIREIRASKSTSRAELAQRFGVSPRAIYAVTKGHSWREGREPRVSLA